MTVKAVIFDLDGTLSTFNLDFRTVRTQVKSFLEGEGVPASLLSLNESVFEMLRKTEEWAENTGRPAQFIEEVKNRASVILEKHELEAASKTNLLPGVVETLKVLGDMELKMGLCTINSEKSVSCILERFGIESFFDVTITRNQVARVKPHPEHIEAALRVLGVSPREAIVVGDSGVDMKSATELKMIAVGLPTGVSTVEQLKNSGANYIVTSILDLPVLILKMKNREKASHKRSEKPRAGAL